MSNMITLTETQLWEEKQRAIINAVRLLADVVEREDSTLLHLNGGEAYISTRRMRALADLVAREMLGESSQDSAVINANAKQLAISHGSILRHRRYAAGLTASEAASLLGIGTIQLRFIEEGTIPAPADADTWYKFDKQGGAS